MKLATYKDGSRDGQLVVVSRDLSTAHFATGIATRMQQALDDWNFIAPLLQDLSVALTHGKTRHAFPFDPAQCMAPLPRAFQWADGSAYLNHVELVRKARGAEMPESFYGDPLMYQGGSDDFPRPVRSRPTFAEHRRGASTSKPRSRSSRAMSRWARSPSQALEGVRLVMLANDWSLRNLIPGRARQGLRLPARRSRRRRSARSR